MKRASNADLSREEMIVVEAGWDWQAYLSYTRLGDIRLGPSGTIGLGGDALIGPGPLELKESRRDPPTLSRH